MAIILKTEGPNGQCVAVWQVTETLETLLGKTTLTPEERKSLSFFKNESRQCEWLAVRALLHELRPNQPTIKYQENGKPYLLDGSEEISISHSGPYIAISLCKGQHPGIDIEHIHEKIKRIAERFLNDKEKAFIHDDIMVEQLCLIWCCKEVLYKIHPEGMLSFKNNLLVSPFSPKHEGTLQGFINKDGSSTEHKLIYKRIGDYMLVYTDFI
jgi:4'-phosphopantetheinyl transferase